MSGPELVTRNGETLTAYAWSSLEAAYAAAGLDPSRYLVVVQGSHGSGGAAASGSTHDAGDTADLRTRDLPSWARADLCRVLVVELRRLGWCAWFRDAAHGGFTGEHIHAVYRWAVPPLSSGARWQVGEYDAGRDGLSSGGRDYHPRPAQSPYVPNHGSEEPPVSFIFKTHADSKPDGSGIGAGRHYLVLPNGNACLLQSGYGVTGLPIVESATEQTDKAFTAAVGTVYNGDR